MGRRGCRPRQASTGHDRAGALDRHDRAPDRGAAEIGVALDRPEQHPGRPGDQVEEGELRALRPQPGPGPEVRPALGQVGAERRASRGFRSWAFAPAVPRLALGSWSRLRASTLTAYVAASTATTTAEPATATSTPPSAGPAILVAEPARPYSEFALASWFRGAISTVRAFRAGVKNAVPMPPSQASRTNEPQRRPPDGQRDRERRLGSAAECVRADHHPAPPEPVGDRPGQRQQQDLGDDGGGKHQAQPGRADPAVQHRPGDRHGGHRRAEQGGHEPGVEAPEVPLSQDPGPAPQPLCPHGTGS